MPDIKITSQDGLIESTIKAKQETYYLITDDNLNSLKQKNIFGDIFMLLASLSWGAYLSVIITIKALPLNSNDSVKNILQALKTLDNVFLIAGVVFSLLAGLMFYLSFAQVQKMKKSKLEIKDKNSSIQSSKQEIVILSATYEWPDGQVDVTDSIKGLVANGTFRGKVESSTFGIADPIYGTVKTLKLHYKINGQEKALNVRDGDIFKLI